MYIHVYALMILDNFQLNFITMAQNVHHIYIRSVTRIVTKKANNLRHIVLLVVHIKFRASGMGGQTDEQSDTVPSSLWRIT